MPSFTPNNSFISGKFEVDDTVVANPDKYNDNRVLRTQDPTLRTFLFDLDRTTYETISILVRNELVVNRDGKPTLRYDEMVAKVASDPSFIGTRTKIYDALKAAGLISFPFDKFDTDVINLKRERTIGDSLERLRLMTLGQLCNGKDLDNFIQIYEKILHSVGKMHEFKLRLADGQETNLLEMRIAYIVGLNVVVRQSGKLFSKRLNRIMTFSDICGMSPLKGSMIKGNGSGLKSGDESITAAVIYQNFVPNLRNMNVFIDSDIRLMQRAGNVTVLQDRPYDGTGTRILTRRGSFSYYIGKGLKYSFDSDKKMPSSIKLMPLDNESIAVIDVSAVPRIDCIIPAATDADVEAANLKASKKLGKPVGELKLTEASSSKFISVKSGKFGEDIEYYPSRYDGETDRGYAKRMSFIGNPFEVKTIIDAIYARTTSHILELSWSKKVLLASYVNARALTVAEAKEALTLGGNAALAMMLIAEKDRDWPKKFLGKLVANKDRTVTAAKSISTIIQDESELEAELNGSQMASTASVRLEMLNEAREAFEKYMAGDDAVLDKFNKKYIAKVLLLKSLRRVNPQAGLDNMNGMDLSVTSGGRMDQTDIDKMVQIYEANSKDKVAVTAMVEHFKYRCNNPEAKFYILRSGVEIISFVAFEPKRDSEGEIIEGELEATSFNVDTAVRGQSIGEVMMQEALDMEARNSILIGETYADRDVTAKYLNTGWIADGYFEESESGTSRVDKLLNIRRDDRNNNKYWGQVNDVEGIYFDGARKSQIPTGCVCD